MPVINISPLRVEGGRKDEAGLRELEIPSSFYFGLEDAVAARNVSGVYKMMAHDLRHGTRTAPSFEDAVALHRTISAIEESAETGRVGFKGSSTKRRSSGYHYRGPGFASQSARAPIRFMR